MNSRNYATYASQLCLYGQQPRRQVGPDQVLQNVAIEGGPGALALLKDADASCLHLACFRLDLDLSLYAAINVWTASVTYKPYALDPDFDL